MDSISIFEQHMCNDIIMGGRGTGVGEVLASNLHLGLYAVSATSRSGSWCPGDR